MTLGTTPQPADVVAELRASFPYTFPDAATRWLADLGTTAAITFPTSFANKQAVKIVSTATQGAGSSYTFANMAAGADYTGRRLIALIGIWSSTEARATTNSVTIGGLAAVGEAHGEFLTGPGTTAGMGIYAAAPTGTTATVAVSLSVAVDACTVVLLSVAGLSTNAANSTLDVHGTGAGSSSASGTLNIPADGVLIVGEARSNNAVITLGGVTKQNQYAVGSGAMAVGFDNRLATQTGRTVSYSAGSTAASALLAKSYT